MPSVPASTRGGESVPADLDADRLRSGRAAVAGCRVRRRGGLALAWWSMAGMTVAGCRGMDARPVENAPVIGSASAPVRREGSGLEVRLWIVAEPRPQVATVAPAEEQPDTRNAATGTRQEMVLPAGTGLDRTLRVYAGRVPLVGVERDKTTGGAAAWARAGFAFCTVPVSALNDVEQQLALNGPVYRQWLGVVPQWSDIAQVSVPRGGLATRCGEEIAAWPAGRIVLATRCWLVPQIDVRGSATMHVEMALWHADKPEEVEHATGRATWWSGQTDREANRPNGDGAASGATLVLPVIGATLSGDEALVIWPAGMEWETGPWPEGERVAGGELPTLAEAVLGHVPASKRRAGLVLLPHVPRQYRWLP